MVEQTKYTFILKGQYSNKSKPNYLMIFPTSDLRSMPDFGGENTDRFGPLQI